MVLVTACLVNEVPPGGMRNFSLLDHTVLVANVDGRFYAMDGVCSHGFASLAQGTLDGFIVTCPRHAARYDLRTGKVVAQPVPTGRAVDLRAYRVEVSDGCVNVDM